MRWRRAWSGASTERVAVTGYGGSRTSSANSASLPMNGSTGGTARVAAAFCAGEIFGVAVLRGARRVDSGMICCPTPYFRGLRTEAGVSDGLQQLPAGAADAELGRRADRLVVLGGVRVRVAQHVVVHRLGVVAVADRGLVQQPVDVDVLALEVIPAQRDGAVAQVERERREDHDHATMRGRVHVGEVGAPVLFEVAAVGLLGHDTQGDLPLVRPLAGRFTETVRPDLHHLDVLAERDAVLLGVEAGGNVLVGDVQRAVADILQGRQRCGADVGSGEDGEVARGKLQFLLRILNCLDAHGRSLPPFGAVRSETEFSGIFREAGQTLASLDIQLEGNRHKPWVSERFGSQRRSDDFALNTDDSIEVVNRYAAPAAQITVQNLSHELDHFPRQVSAGGEGGKLHVGAIDITLASLALDDPTTAAEDPQVDGPVLLDRVQQLLFGRQPAEADDIGEQLREIALQQPLDVHEATLVPVRKARQGTRQWRRGRNHSISST